ncbi:MAG: glycoside hydrolase family 37 [Clostridia bacterium]|nr:glycoside hydrolase family 37 [Clostridia bacterium]
MERYQELLKNKIYESCQLMTREPSGILTHPYMVPSSPDSPFYAMSLWDWDSWFISLVLGQIEADTKQPGRFMEYEQGSILNFIDHTDEQGHMPIHLDENGALYRSHKNRRADIENMHKPVIAQHVALLFQRSHCLDWIQPYFPVIEKFLNRYLTVFYHEETGLVFWQDDFAVGVDNDPSVFYRPEKSCASIFLNSLLYRELLAFGYLMERSGQADRAAYWRSEAQKLAEAIKQFCWDERDGTFYSADLALRPIDPSDWLHKGAPRHWPCLLLRIDSWSSFLPLWAGLATQEQAVRMVGHYRDNQTFNAQFGVRTLSRLEKMYSLHASNNPSNWLGPVWGISNYLVFSGLVKYGFADDARDLARKTIFLFGRDLEKTGTLHEYYHPDTGDPIMTPGFQNWNDLVLNMIAYLEGRKMVECF